MIRKLSYLLVVAAIFVVMFGAPAGAQVFTKVPEKEPDRIRGQIAAIEGSTIVLKTRDDKTVRLGMPKNLTVLKLSKASFTDVAFGVYVGAVSKLLPAYSPIVRDSMSWLHQGFELRIFDDKLRGLALGHTKWDLTPDSVITHGWVDDMEVRVFSIKYGPTEEEETDVEISRDVPITKLSLGDKNLIKPGAQVFAGAQNGAGGNYEAVFIMVGVDGVVPAL